MKEMREMNGMKEMKMKKCWNGFPAVARVSAPLFLSFFFISFISFIPVKAQTFTQRLQQQEKGKATVTIHQSDSISDLVNKAALGPAAPAAAPAAATTTPSTSTTESSATADAANKPAAHSTATESTAEGEKEPAPVDLTKKIMRNSYKINGYRVQVFAGGNSRKDRQEAEKIGNSVKSSFPEAPVYVHFYSPRWICRVGNYRTYEEAHQMLVSLRKMGFSQATIVKGKITVPSY